MIQNLFNTGGFHWWVGVVEDRMDPLLLGRCRVRVLGYHTEDKAVLPTEDLPWAMPIQSITSGAVTGFGRSATGLLESSWVFGFFADGEDGQQPLILGSFAGIPQTDFYARMAGKGFTDPFDVYPLKELLDEPDTNRLARNQSIGETIVQDKRDSRRLSVEVAFQKLPSQWNQPRIPYNAKYPFNHVTFSESGHVLEMDDTANNERLHVYHRMGTFVEIDSRGTMVRKIIGDDYHIVESNGYIFIRGKANVTVEGTINIYTKNDCNLQVDGNLTAHAHGNMEFKSGKKMIFSAADNIEMHTDKTVKINADSAINMKSGSKITLDGKVATVSASPITEVATLKMNGMSMTPIPPRAPSVGSISTIPAKSPREQIITVGESLGLAQLLEIQAQKFQAEETVGGVPLELAREYADIRQSELETGLATSIPSIDVLEGEPNGGCETGNQAVKIARKDVGVVESRDQTKRGKNCGGVQGGGELPLGNGPFGSGNPGRIDEMLRIAGYDNQKHIATGGNSGKGEGYYWCAAAVTAWWKEAGITTPPTPTGRCVDWAQWAKGLGLYSDAPEVGGLIIYGPEGKEHHIGLVASVGDTLGTIEGNTSNGSFDRNGGGCFAKSVPRWNTRTGPESGNRHIAFIKIPTNVCVPVPKTTSVETLEASMDIKNYLNAVRGQFGLTDEVWNQLPSVVEKFEINTPARMAHFLGQIKHESGSFRRTEENLSYSSVNTIRAAFRSPTRDKDDNVLNGLVKNPEALGNFVYANRIGNGDVASGDGYRYRGRGFIQTTGKSNYMAFNKFVPEDVVQNPDLLKTKYALLSSGFWWKNNNLNSLADRGFDRSNITTMTRRINGGTNGLEERIRFVEEFATLI
jgi:putative chitinase